MDNEYTMTRIRRDVLQKLKAIAEREKRTVPMQIAHFVEREEMTIREPAYPSPQPTQDAQR